MRIMTDTASMYDPSEGKRQGVTVIPACTIMDGTVYRDFLDMDSDTFLERIAAGSMPTTSQPAIGDLIDVFEESEEEILALFIGDGLSGGYQNAVGAKNSIDDNAHIRIVDTKTLAGAEHYLVQKAVYLREQGLSIDEIEQELLKSVETSASFVIPADFEFLKRSGRLTPIAAKIGAMIKIVPVLTQTEDMRKITPFAVKRSWRKATASILDQLEKIGVNEDYMIYICHGGDVATAEEVLEQTRVRFPQVEIQFMSLSPTMITHGGPGCVLVQTIKK